MEKNQLIEAQDLAGIYRDIAEIIGVENALQIYNHLKGQQVTFPMKLFTTDYIMRQVIDDKNGKSIKQIAVKFNYTERHLHKMIKEFKKRNTEEEA